VPDEHDVALVVQFEHGDDVGDVVGESGVGAGEVRPVAEAGQRGAKHLVPCRREQRHDPAPAPAAVPSAVYEDERGHRFLTGSAASSERSASAHHTPRGAGGHRW
jgi:hypothetical protein